MTARERSGSMSEAYSVDAERTSRLHRGNSAGTGPASVTVHGSSIGLAGMTAMVRSGQTGCEGTEWESETSVRCLAGHGGQGTRRVTMTARERSGSMSEAYSVDVGSVSTMRRDNSAGTGSASVTVHGSSLGLVGMTAMVRSGQTGCEGTEWESETSVRCLSAAISRASLSVIITSGESGGSMSEAYSVEVAEMSVMRRGNAA